MTIKKKVAYISIVSVFLLVTIYLFFIYEDKKEYTKEAFVETESVKKIEEGVASSSKMYDFILSKVPNPDAFLKIHQEEEHFLISDRQKATMEMFYAAIKQQEIDYLTASLDMDTLQSLWGTTNDFQHREQIVIDLLKDIDQNGQLSNVSYQLEKEEYGIEGNKGILTLLYEDGREIITPFTFKEIGEDDHTEYTLVVSLQDIVGKL